MIRRFRDLAFSEVSRTHIVAHMNIINLQYRVRYTTVHVSMIKVEAVKYLKIERELRFSFNE